MPEALASTPSMGHKIKLPVKQRLKELQSKVQKKITCRVRREPALISLS